MTGMGVTLGLFYSSVEDLPLLSAKPTGGKSCNNSVDKHKVESAGVKHLDDLFFNERVHCNEENRGSGKSLEMRQLTIL